MELITKEFQELKIVFTNNGEINGTQTSKLFNKDIREFMRSKAYKEYVKALSVHLNCDVGNLHITYKGNSAKEQGTFLHPRLLVFFARWLSPKFAVWCDELILNQLKSEIQFKQTIINDQQLVIDEIIEDRDKMKWWLND